MSKGINPILTDAALAAIGTAYRHNWSDFDGRSLKAELGQVRELLAAEVSGDIDKAIFIYRTIVCWMICTVPYESGEPCYQWVECCEEHTGDERDAAMVALIEKALIEKARASQDRGS